MKHLPSVEQLLESYCNEKIESARKIDDRYAALWLEIKHYLLNGGKRMRPRLVMLAYEAYGGKHTEAIIPIAAAWELLHACLLIHDDIIDRDDMRHGHPNIAGRYQTIYGELGHKNISHYSLSAALLSGDLMLMSTYELVNSALLSSDQKLTTHSYLNKALFAVAGGELIDSDSVLYPISKSNPYSVAKFKTASYSLQLPLQCGAAMAEAPTEELEKLSALGLHAGTAYQFQDDLLGVLGESKTTGKSNRSDIIEKKRTLLILETIKQLDTVQAQRLAELYTSDQPLSNDAVEEIVTYITTSGASEVVSKSIKTELDESLRIIGTLSIDSTYKETFLGIIAKFTSRTS